MSRSHVYIARRGNSGPVKIGFSTNLPVRLKDLQRGGAERIEFIRTFPGEQKDELWMHKRFVMLRLSGEWFDFHEDMMTVEPPSWCEGDARSEKRARNCSLTQRLIVPLKAAGQTSEQIAEVVGLSIHTVNTWFYGNSGMGLESVVALCERYECVWMEFCRMCGRKYSPGFKREMLDFLTEKFGSLECDVRWPTPANNEA